MRIQPVVFGSKEHQALIGVRFRVLREPLGRVYTPEELAAETQCVHLAAIRDGEVVGGVLLTPQGEGAAKLRQMAVAPECQGQGIGALLVRALEEEARARHIRDISLHARISAEDFYRKLGYEPVGEIFEQIALPHRRMVKRLAE